MQTVWYVPDKNELELVDFNPRSYDLENFFLYECLSGMDWVYIGEFD